ncbi:SulP family inorganic anion transporter [Phaeovulum sp. W22_SRMD_FR3]|uniref:SulP family inorganic anion transporter n=1 Tax=Phaeovulum sp. W22_SRMD_FR3 TaxID=3240274 RepID=UPI003F9EB79F
MLITRLREGYNAGDLRADALAGLTVAIVALPLSMAIAIASGLGPERGLFTAIVGGFLVSLLGGSRHQVGGPAGAFIVLVAACVAQIGVPGLVLATVLSGLMLILLGLLRLGNTIRFIPYPVTLGFTAGIGVIILLSQMKDLFGLHLSGAEPGPVIAKVEALWAARGSLNPASVVVAVLSIALIQALRRWRPRWPNLLIAVVVASVLVALLGLPVETIASRFGSLPRVPPVPSLPPMDAALVMQALPWAVSFTLLGAIESLLSAMVADGMTGGQHRSNVELVAQGVANIGAALFGGMCVTGTIARTATNVRAGSRGPVSGMLHALFVLGFMLIAAPLAGYIPLPALAGVLVLVAWGMIEREECAVLIRASRADAAVLAVTFFLVVFRDLSEGIVAGFALGGLVFIRRMAEAARVEAPEPAGPEDPPSDPDIVVHHLRGVMFFGAAALLSAVLDRIAAHPRALIVDLGDVPFVDSTAARMLVSVAQKMTRRQGQLYISSARPALRAALAAQGLEAPAVVFCADIAAAQHAARLRLDAAAA